MGPMEILWLGDPACHASALVGGKAANLSRIASDYLVPPGFCLTVDFLDRIGSNSGNFEEDSSPILAPDFFEALASAYERLAAQCGNMRLSVAVRSSAVEEDSPFASFAGAYETYLNVVGVDALAAAVIRCRASRQSPRVLEYRRSRGLPIDNVRLAVLVQQFVPANVSAVVFSANPVGGRADDVIITANWGLGDSIVSARATPDTYLVDKHTMTLNFRHIASKRIITMAAPGGTRDVVVPRLLRRRPVLDEAHAMDLARLATTLEARMGGPVDVECSFCDDRLYVLQCRPLTGAPPAAATISGDSPPPPLTPHTDAAATAIAVPSHFPVAWEQPEDEHLFWFIDRMHVPEPIPVLAGEFLRHCYEDGLHAGAVAYGWRITSRVRRINTYWYWSVTPEVMSEEELEEQNELSQRLLDTAFGRLGELWHADLLPEVKRYLEAWKAFDLRAAPMSELLAHLEGTIVWSRRVWELHFFVVMPLMAALSAFDDLWCDLFGSEDALAKEDGLAKYGLLEGLDNKSLEVDRALWQLSRRARASAEIRAALGEPDASEMARLLEQTVEGRTFLDELHAFLERYGHRAKNFVLSSPSWIEDPTLVFTNLRRYVARPDRDLAGERQERARERERLVADVRRRLADYPASLAGQFDFYLNAAQEASVLQEDHNFWIDQRAMYQIRRVLVEFGRRFSDAGVIDHQEDVFHLTLDELRQTASALSAVDRRQLVLARQAEIAHFRSITPPPALGTKPAGSPPDTPLSRAIDKFFGVPLIPGPDPHTLRGHPGSAGTVRGPARVVRSLSEADRVRAGDVLVAVTTMPAWTPLFATVAAVVTDVGGVTSHCAIVAREYGIPAVVGTMVATSVIKDGHLLEVDGQAGTVRILEPSQ
jgi:phosphohistidine swiveling domain-containing protein